MQLAYIYYFSNPLLIFQNYSFFTIILINFVPNHSDQKESFLTTCCLYSLYILKTKYR